MRKTSASGLRDASRTANRAARLKLSTITSQHREFKYGYFPRASRLYARRVRGRGAAGTRAQGTFPLSQSADYLM
ncbi:hypothetical protein BE221DRAFT_74431 [Ostreococcus tauri]|uniref:Uncharacterized protein n=1 Tax=Ostreococcus tauri TaxID=70448 RepID=A0A1Y5IES6_OSTTA|nr:hypothetical protein BE221DRAFT_74431 [Ostreococcus tauri]